MKFLQALLGVAIMGAIVAIENLQIEPRYKTLIFGFIIFSLVIVIYTRRIRIGGIKDRSSYAYRLVLLFLALTLLVNFLFTGVGILPLALLWIFFFFLGEFVVAARE